MRKSNFRKVSVVLAAMAGFVMLSACQGTGDDQSTVEYLKQYKDNKDPLAVDYYSPVGEIKIDQNKIVVHFTQPMVSLSSLKDQGQTNDLVEISPKPEGVFKWVNTKTLTYQVKGNMPNATQFKVTVKAGHQSLLGFALLKDLEFSFNTARPLVSSVTPAGGATQIRLDQKFTVNFNQKVNINQVKPLIRLTDSSQKAYDFKTECFRESEDEPVVDQCSKIIVLPQTSFNKSTQINLDILKGLKGIEGDLDSLQDQKFFYSTYGDFQISSIVCVDGVCSPKPTIKLMSTTPISSDEITKFIQFEPKVGDGEKNYGYWSDADKAFYYYPTLKANQSYTMTVSPELQDTYGQKLATTKTYQFQTTHHEPQFKFPYFNDQVINSQRSLDFGFRSRNVTSISARFRDDMSESEIIELMQSSKKVLNAFDADNKWTVMNDLQGEFEDEFRFHSIPGSGVLKDKTTAILLAAYQSPEVTDYNYETKTQEPRRFWFLKQITDLAVSAKISPLNSMVWVTSLNTGSAIGQTTIKIFNAHGRELYQGVTNEQGLLDLPGQEELVRLSKIQEKDSEEPHHFPFYVFAYKDADRAFITTEWSEGLGDYIYLSDYMLEGNENEADDADVGTVPAKNVTVRAHYFTDRGLYKPGEDVFIKGYLREVTDQGLKPYHSPLTINVDPPNGGKPTEYKVTPNERGNFSISYKIPDSNALGSYYIGLLSPQKNVEFTPADKSFSVQKFRTPELKVEVEDLNKKNFRGDKLKVQITSNYLFGSPVKKGTGSFYITKSVSDFTPKQTDGWQFGRLYESREPDESFFSYYVTDNFELDDEGNFTFDEPTEAKMADPVEYVIESDVSDKSGQSVSGRQSIVVHPAEFYIGGKADKFFYNVGDKAKPAFAILNLDGEYQFGQSVHVDLVAVKWITVKRETLYGQFESEVERKEEVIQSCDKKAETKDNFCEFELKDAGYFYFRMTAKDSGDRVATTDVPVYVTGGSYAFWPSDEAHTIELVKDKTKYQNGDVAKIIVKSPYSKAQALIAVERNKVIRYFVKELVGGTPVIELPLNENDAPNIFVRVVLIKGALDLDPSHDAKTGEQEQALVKAGTIELEVEPFKKNFVVEAKPEKLIYKPGETAKVSFKVPEATVGQEAELTVMVVDEGVLLAGGYSLEDPLQTFFAPYSHEVHQMDGRIYYIGTQGADEKMEDPSAGGGDMQNYRKKFIPNAYFNPEVITQNGLATVEFPIPDQLTTFKIMVVANHNNDRFATTISEFKTQKDVMIRPALPRFVRYGDEVESKVVLHNNTKEALTVDVSINAEGFQILDGQSDSIKIAAQKSEIYRVRLKVENDELFKKFKDAYQSGNDNPRFVNNVSFVAKSGSTEDAVSIDVPVYFEKPDETVATSGVSVDVTSEFLEKTSDVDENFGDLTVNLSGNLTARLKDKIQSLRLYPYECLEQRISKVYPFVIFPHRDDLFQGKDKDATYRSTVVRDFLSYLAENQAYNGEFKLWPNSNPSPHITLLVMEFLHYAKIAGYDVSSLVSKAKEQLFTYLKQDQYQFKNYTPAYLDQLKANTLYVYHLMGEPQIGYYGEMHAKFAQFEELTQNRLIEMFFAQDSKDTVIDTWLNTLKNNLRIKGSTAYFEPLLNSGYYLGNNARVTTARTLQTLLKIDPAHPFVFQLLMYLVDENAKSTYYSSADSLETLKALQTYQAVFPGTEDPVSAKLTLNDKDLIQSKLTLAEPTDQLKLPVDKLPEAMTLKIQSETKNPLFYDVKFRYVLKNYRTFGLEQGMSYSRDYYDLDGNLVTDGKFKHGNTYRVVLNFYFADASEYVAIKEPLPAGFEPLNFALSTTRTSFQNTDTNSTGAKLAWYLNHREFHDREILLFADWVPRGFFEFEYYVNVTNSGSYFVPGSKAMEMYFPETFGTTPPQTIVIQ